MLDFTLTQRWGAARLKLSLENLLAEEYFTQQGSQTAELRELGQTASLALSYGSK